MEKSVYENYLVDVLRTGAKCRRQVVGLGGKRFGRRN